jgi:hypothetical protein
MNAKFLHSNYFNIHKKDDPFRNFMLESKKKELCNINPHKYSSESRRKTLVNLGVT